MQELQKRPPERINQDLLRFVLATPSLGFWLVAAALGTGAAAFVVTITVMMTQGLGVLGYTNNHLWMVPITHFVFLVGISHAGVMISAVLRLNRAEWRRPVTRAAEILTVCALTTAAIFPVIHTGRMWRTIYWTFPYDFARNIWPNYRSALMWDASSIFAYLFGTLLFVYVALVPDLAVARDSTTGVRRQLYATLALGFRGTVRQWRLQGFADILLAALIVPVFVSVHSTVAANFNVSLVPGWHTTLLGPYYVISAIHSGVSAVVTLMVILRATLRLQNYITLDLFDAMGRLMIMVASVFAFFYVVDLSYSLYSRDPVEIATRQLMMFTPPYSVLFIIFVMAAFVIPFPLWWFRWCRRNVWLMLATTLLVNVGMWVERYLLVVAPLSYKSPLVFSWITAPTPRFLDYVLIAGSLAMVALGVLLFAKLFPIVPIFDVKEGPILRQEVQIGRRRVPAVIRATTEGELST